VLTVVSVVSDGNDSGDALLLLWLVLFGLANGDDGGGGNINV